MRAQTLLILGAVALLAGCSRRPTDPAPLVSTASAAVSPAPTKRFTKQEFAAYAETKTKAQIREEFGPPDFVHDDDDSWRYENLPIYDQEAGTQSAVTIQFAGLDGPNDEVAIVRY